MLGSIRTVRLCTLNISGRFSGKPLSSFCFRYQSTHTSTNPKSSNVLIENRLKQLESSVNSQIQLLPSDRSRNIEKVNSIFDSIYDFQTLIYGFDKLSPATNPYIIKSNELLKQVLRKKDTHFDEELLQTLFLKQPSYSTLETIIKSYYSRDSRAYIESSVAMVPFRKLIWDGDFQAALNYVELTNGNARFLNHRKDIVKRVLGYFGGSLAGLILGLHGVIVTFFPELIDAGAGGTTYGVYGIYACILTYFINCGFLASLSFSSRGMENGNLMFQHYTMPQDWFMKVEQMKMCSKILEADAEIHGLDGFATREVVSRIQKMGFEVNEPEQEIMLRQYWYSSGEGFVWVEPDLDPAELEWWAHLDDVGVKKVWDQDLNKIEAAATKEKVADEDSNADIYFSEDDKKP